MITNFQTKAEVLEFLRKHIKKSKIENLYHFELLEWTNNESKILKNITKKFDKKIIVRSSAKGEDSYESSKAGTYESVLNVNSQSIKDVKDAINLVKNSYLKKGNKDLHNRILIQNQTTNITHSGVIFSRTSDIGAPYFVINYDIGNITDSVTKGFANNTIKIFRNCSSRKLSKKWKALLQSVKEIEKILNNTSLDIEFGITNSNKIVIFQARPITSINKLPEKNIEFQITKSINSLRKKFKKLNESNPFGTNTFFSDMADWNPAEIIGNNPNLFDYSLYDYLIMKEAWRKGRTQLGYQNVNNASLMVKFGNKPYVDVRSSFNSLIPNTIPNHIKKKLISYYFKKLKLNPSLHDKVEFEILFSCYDLALKSRLKELKNFGMSQKEIDNIENKLKTFSNNIFQEFHNISDECSNLVNKMKYNRKQILKKTANPNYLHSLNVSKQLLNDCKILGTIPFSAMARIAFIGSIMMKSLLKEGYIDSNFYDNFMNSIETAVSEFSDDFGKYCNNKLSKKKFLIKYGHLRAGTYDITARRYDQESALFENLDFMNNKKIKKPSKNFSINNILLKNGISLDTMDFLSFVRNSLKQREELKFEFSRNLSDAIEFIVKAGKELGFSRSEMAHLDIKTILNFEKNSKKNLQKLWKNKIQKQKQCYLIDSYLMLPPIIFSDLDFEYYEYHISKPNFITNIKVTAPLVLLKNSDWSSLNLDGKIILVENADPGYDWLFTKKPAGLITKYGGVASHMSIRCAELGLPAAIGCGEIFYENLIKSSKILLDCKNEHIIILEHEKLDEILEAQKILKSLGYIK